MKSHPHRPLWIFKKKYSHPTISLVFGEAQQVSPSQSAAEKLPQILLKASPSASSLVSMAQPGKSLEEPSLSAASHEPESSSAHEAGRVPTDTVVHDASSLAAEGLHSVPAHPSSSDMTVVQTCPPATPSDFAVSASSDPSSLTPRHTPLETLSHKPSWFASWTQTKVGCVPDPGSEKTSRPILVPEPDTGFSSSLDAVHPQTTNSSTLHQLLVPSMTGNPLPATESTPTQAAPQSTHDSMAAPSPLHEDAAKLPPAKLPLATSPAVLQGVDASNAIPTPTNRFTLSIPLLGRAMVPIEKTIATAKCDDIRSMSLPVDQPPPCRQLMTTQVSVPTKKDFAPIAETTDVNITADTVVQPRVQTSTWWSYLGWASTQSPSSQRLESLEPISDEVTPSAVPDASPSPVGEITAQSIGTLIPQKSAEGSEDQAVLQNPSPVLSAGQSEPQGFAWYAPWSWSRGSSTPAMSPHSDTQVTGGEDNVLSELITSDIALESQGPATSEANPISSTITNNRSGWISFFSARAVAMKSITNDNHNEEMEVMDLDEDEAPAAAVSPPTAHSSAPLSKDVHTRPPLLIPAGVSPVSPSSSSTAGKKPEDKSIPGGGSVDISDAVRRGATKRPPSPTPSKKSGVKTPIAPPSPNLVLPTWEDIFHTQPRARVPAQPPSALSKTFQYVSDVLFARDELAANKKGKARERPLGPYEMALPRSWDIGGGQEQPDALQGCQRVVVIGVHGWFPGAVMRTVLGEPTGTSLKFVNMAVQALTEFQDHHKVKFLKITKIPLEGEGTISRRVDKLYQRLIGNQEWMDDLRNADAIFFATHSQGSIVSTHILDRLIADGHIQTTRDLGTAAVAIASGSASMMRPLQRVCCLALCGIHLGPLRYLSTSSLVQPYIQYFESIAARELFEFQNTESQISKDYVKALGNVLDNGVKMVYIASLNDQVVGLYSGLFTSATHPLILRALYIDGDVYHSSDFLSNLLVLLLRIRNVGLSDGGLLAHLSEATAGSLNGVGHSTAYEETATYSFAIDYLFLSDSGQQQSQVELVVEPFDARTEQNDYEIPWALRDLIANNRVAELFSEDFIRLRDAFRQWQPKTAILRDVKKKLQPIQRLSSTILSKHDVDSMSKL